jgi:hypothetical protein
VPIRSRLVPLSGTTNKLSIAGALVRAVSSIVPGARVLVDSWYMRRRFVLPLVSRGMRIIGQVRRDTALFLPPEPVDPAAAKRRGRPRQSGQRLSTDQIDALAAETHCLKLYGKSLEVRLRSTLVVVRFLKATVARALWYEIFDPKKQRWSQRRLLLATETQLVPTQVLQFYASRWGIESLFQNLKRWWGANNHWQQSRRVLELWMQIRSTGYALMHLLALQLPEAFPLAGHRAVARAQTRHHRRPLRRLDAPAFLRTSVPPGLRPKVGKIHLPHASHRPVRSAGACLSRPMPPALAFAASFIVSSPLRSPPARTAIV